MLFEKVRITKEWAMPSSKTFDIIPIKNLITTEMTLHPGLWIDPFANSSRIADITNDLDPQYDTDYHLDAKDFLAMFEDNSVDGVLYDPPYSSTQVAQCYKQLDRTVTWTDTTNVYWTTQKNEIARILKPGGVCISFGWIANGIGNKRGFVQKRILIVSHGGVHNDTLVTVEKKKKLFTLF